MPWTIRYHQQRPEKPQVGDMWPAPWLLETEGARRFFLTAAYERDQMAKRSPLVVRLPDGTDFCVDQPYSSAREKREGWQVTGEPPKLTLLPSINCAGSYHGWIRDGVITDDCEGRRFPSSG